MREGSPNRNKEDEGRSSSRSSEDTLLEHLTENSRYTSLDAF